MSILMDALKQQAPVTPVSHFWRNLAIALALILAVLAGFAAGYLLLQRAPAPEVKQPVAVTPATTATIAQALTQPAGPVAEPVVVEKITETLPPQAEVVTVTAQAAPVAEPVPEPEVSAELRERFASALAQSEQQPRANNTITAHSAPAQDISMLDLTLQQQLPRLKFEAHVYATQPAQRWVKVNGKSLQEGQWVTADVRLREITPHYVLLEFGQTLFSMRALSEW
jgi:general secretion pathway protein B